MKEGIHPKYTDTTIRCACGSEIKTRSTNPGRQVLLYALRATLFYTGKQKFVDTAGRVEKFMRKYGKSGGK